TNISRRIRSVSFFCLTVFQVIFYPLRELKVISFINRIYFFLLRKFHIRVRKVESPDWWVECKSVYSKTSGVNQHRRGSVNDISCCYLSGSGLQEIFDSYRSSHRSYSSINRKNSPYRNVYVNV